MKRIINYSEFLLEKVYLSNTIFKKYQLMVDPYSNVGQFNFDLRGGYNDIEMELQTYGDDEDKQIIFRIPTKLSHLPEKETIFKSIVNDTIYILNKNKLGYKFSINKFGKERSPLNEYVIIDINKEMSMLDLERLSQTTKIVNSKVKDIGDFDKMIYQTTNVNKL